MRHPRLVVSSDQRLAEADNRREIAARIQLVILRADLCL
jgi:hypothetical protein